MFLPAGRLHAVGAGNLLVEIQQNSDTTYRVFDWNRVDENGKARQLHVDQALQCINFDDIEPKLIEPKGELLVRHELFEIQKWDLNSPREIAPLGQFAIIGCLTGLLRCSDIDFAPGKFCLLPASSRDRQVSPRSAETSLLRVAVVPESPRALRRDRTYLHAQPDSMAHLIVQDGSRARFLWPHLHPSR
jgi:mannose-6-phosphate isomerase